MISLHGLLLSYLLILLLFSTTARAELPLCDSERPNSWATHRTLTIPESCLSGSAAEASAAAALCCVYTHVVVGQSSSNQNPNAAILETYDGSLYTILGCSGAGSDGDGNSDASIGVMDDVMGRVCGMSMGSRDCYDRSACIEAAEAEATVLPSTAPSKETLGAAEPGEVQEIVDGDGDEEEDWDEEPEDLDLNTTKGMSELQSSSGHDEYNRVVGSHCLSFVSIIATLFNLIVF